MSREWSSKNFRRINPRFSNQFSLEKGFRSWNRINVSQEGGSIFAYKSLLESVRDRFKCDVLEVLLLRSLKRCPSLFLRSRVRDTSHHFLRIRVRRTLPEGLSERLRRHLHYQRVKREAASRAFLRNVCARTSAYHEATHGDNLQGQSRSIRQR